MYKVLPLILCVFLMMACSRKDDAATPAVRAGGSWNLAGAVVNSGYSETETRQGYTLRFADTAGDNSISFIFRTRPAGAGAFVAAADTTAASHVALRMMQDGLQFRPAASGAPIEITAVDGKLRLVAESIQMVPDSGNRSNGSLSFSLREY